MTMTRTMLAVCALWIALAAGARAEPVEHRVSVEVQVPNDVFYVSAVGGWAGATQLLQWDMAGQRLRPLRQWLEMRSTMGPITVRADGDTVLAGDGRKIPLRIRLDSGQRRCEVFRDGGASADCLVLSAAEAAEDRRVSLDIVPGVPVGGYQPGVYHGVVNLLFESAL
ncbi:CS1 type fimbrial major subunit [Chromobacterium sp. ATCC 53434]|uniref:CS1 type fimbrial major subunit n=1 Tax=Chromobacterium sp. (strain ATCC 53434 / SC 14030) TaxID=2059672 RepID=UPI001305367C|nr:CS1 type fimbrial major subunit [Chromobacterium sp. ATCC 53434]